MSSEVETTSDGFGESTRIDIGAEGDEPDGGGIAREQIFEMLSNERRRYALEYLKGDTDGAVELRELVDYVAARENDVDEEALHYEQRKRVYSALRQTHLPRLAECGLVDYDVDRGRVSLNGTAREVQMYMEYVPEDDIPWCYHYLGLSVVLGAVVALTVLGVFPFARLPGTALATLIVGTLGVSAVVHAVHTKRNELGAKRELER